MRSADTTAFSPEFAYRFAKTDDAGAGVFVHENAEK
jgi:hypothetical protein